MSGTHLNEIYTPQVGANADRYTEDCSMVTLGKLQTYELMTGWTVDMAFADILAGKPQRGIFPNELRDWLRSKGLMCDWVNIPNPETLYNIIRQKKPVTFMVDYSYWVMAGFVQFTGFTGYHFVEANGFDIDPKGDNHSPDAVVCHDPYHTDGKGAYIPVETAVFFKSFAYVGQGLVPALPIQKLGQVTTPGTIYRIVDTVPYCITVRSQNSGTSTPLGVIDRLAGGKYVPIQIVKPANPGAQVYVQLTSPYPGAWVWWPYLTPLAV